MLHFYSMKKLMTTVKPVLLPLQFILSFVLFICCLHEVVYTEDVLLRELCKSLAAVSMLILLAAASNNSFPKNDDTYENN